MQGLRPDSPTAGARLPRLTLRRLARSRWTALVALLSLNLLGTSAPISALAAATDDCSVTSGATPCLFHNFEMDGNTPQDIATAVDWDTSPFPYSRVDFVDPATGDQGFVQGSKFSDQSSWTCTVHNNPPKDEILTGSIAIHNFVIGGATHQIGFFKFTRQSGGGDTFIDFVFSKGTPPASAGCPGLPLRAVGDVIVTFTFSGNSGGNPTLDLGRWNGTAYDSIASGQLGTGFQVAFSSDGTFGEGALDLSATGVGPFTCHSFGNTFIDSRSAGSGAPSEMKDVLGPGVPPLCETPTPATTSSPTGGSVVPGTIAHDTATITGVAGAGDPNGSVKFFLCGPGLADAATATGCPDGTGTQIGGAITSHVSSAGPPPTATYTSANTTSAQTLAIGTYCWRAEYTDGATGDYSNVTHTNGGSECFTTVKQPTTTATTSSPTGGSVVPGTAATDAATVSGGQGQPTPTGTVSFFLCGPGLATAADANTGCASGGTAVGSAVTLVNGAASSPSTATAGVSTLGIGLYCWRAEYSGDGFYLGSSHTNNTTECFTTAKQNVTVATSPASQSVDFQNSNSTIHDTATVTLGFAPSAQQTFTPGTVTFRLYGPSNTAPCNIDGNPTGNALYTSSAIQGTYDASTGKVTASTGNLSLATAGVTGPGVYWWVATYSGDAYNNGGVSLCGDEKVQAADANIQISPLTDTDPVGDTHVLTAHVNVNDGTGFVNAPDGTTINFSLQNSNGANAAFVNGVNSCKTSGGTGSCSVSITGTSAGQTTITASTSVTVSTVSIGRSTGDGKTGDSANAVKTWVDANIAISPLSAADPVGDNHTLTATVKVNAGDGNGYVNAPDGTLVTFNLQNSNGATASFVGGVNTCTTISGSCSVSITSPTAGLTAITATTTLSVGGVSLTRTTGDSHAGDSASAGKTWADANITISPLSATDPVGDTHQLTATVKVNSGNGSGYVNAPNGTLVTFTLQNTNGANAAFVGGVNSCTTTNGSCSVSITSSAAGHTSVTASVTLTVAGVSLTRTTGDTHTGDSASAGKSWVDAYITISPLTASDALGDTHVLTATVKVNAGDGNGYVNAPNGTLVTFSLQNANGATAAFVGGVNTCTTTSGSCSVSISSPTAGTTTITASTSVVVGGLTLGRSTGDGISQDSANATKAWVNARISITPQAATDAVGDTHTLTATVQVNNGNGSFAPAPDGTLVTFALQNSGGATATFVNGTNTCTTTNGSCSVSITSPTAGTTTVTASASVTVNGVPFNLMTNGQSGNSAAATKKWVDASVAISPLEATNVITHAHVFTITVTAIPGSATPVVFNSVDLGVSPAPTTQSNTCDPAHWTVTGDVLTCTLTINSNVTAVYTVNATAHLTIGGVTLTRTTSPDGSQAGPGGSGPAKKTYVAPSSSLAKAERDVTTPDTTVDGGGFSAGPITAHPLDVLEYRLTYTNSGDGAASGVTVTDVVPVAHSAYVPGSCAGGASCSYDAATHTITWDLGTVAAHTDVVLTFRIALTNDFPNGTTTSIQNFGVVSTNEEAGSKQSNVVVANVAMGVLAARAPGLPTSGHPTTATPVVPWAPLGLLAMTILAAIGAMYAVRRSSRA